MEFNPVDRKTRKQLLAVIFNVVPQILSCEAVLLISL